MISNFSRFVSACNFLYRLVASTSGSQKFAPTGFTESSRKRLFDAAGNCMKCFACLDTR